MSWWIASHPIVYLFVIVSWMNLLIFCTISAIKPVCSTKASPAHVAVIFNLWRFLLIIIQWIESNAINFTFSVRCTYSYGKCWMKNEFGFYVNDYYITPANRWAIWIQIRSKRKCYYYLTCIWRSQACEINFDAWTGHCNLWSVWFVF